MVITAGTKAQIIDADDFCEFVKQHGHAAVSRRLNYDALWFVQNYVFPPSHADLLSVRGTYKKRVPKAMLSLSWPPAPTIIIRAQARSSVRNNYSQKRTTFLLLSNNRGGQERRIATPTGKSPEAERIIAEFSRNSGVGLTIIDRQLGFRTIVRVKQPLTVLPSNLT
jgi:hypothetical protein